MNIDSNFKTNIVILKSNKDMQIHFNNMTIPGAINTSIALTLTHEQAATLHNKLAIYLQSLNKTRVK